MKIAVSYTIFALLAIAANIGSQDLLIRAYHGRYAVTFSVLLGTVVGLLVKYLLDKKYIFCFRTRDVADEARTFVMYTIMGVVTTLIFWSFEFGFDYLFQSRGLRYLGGVIGLTLGYWLKYQLDRRYVFQSGVI